MSGAPFVAMRTLFIENGGDTLLRHDSGGMKLDVRQMFGFVMSTGGIGLNLNHDCAVCVKLVEMFGTCEYMHQANPSRCTCERPVPKWSRNVQGVLQTASTDRVRLRYWRVWARTTGIQMGLMVEPETAPNLPKTDGKEGSSE